MRWSIALVFAGLTGCTPPAGSDPPSTTVATDAGSSTAPPEGTSAAVDASAGVSVSDDTSDGGPSWPAPAPPFGECDLFTNNCPSGQKCTILSNDGGPWNAYECVPIAERPVARGEPCTVVGSATSGLDDCEVGTMCWNVDWRTGEGTCVAFCVGSEHDPYCDEPMTQCSISGAGLLLLCLPRCDPLTLDCPDGQVCVPIGQVGFFCATDASGDQGAPGDECRALDGCDPGAVCVNAASLPECAGLTGCCTSLCQLGDPAPPCMPGHVCMPWYEAGTAPVGDEDVGVCVGE